MLHNIESLPDTPVASQTKYLTMYNTWVFRSLASIWDGSVTKTEIKAGEEVSTTATHLWKRSLRLSPSCYKTGVSDSAQVLSCSGDPMFVPLCGYSINTALVPVFVYSTITSLIRRDNKSGQVKIRRGPCIGSTLEVSHTCLAEPGRICVSDGHSRMAPPEVNAERKTHHSGRATCNHEGRRQSAMGLLLRTRNIQRDQRKLQYFRRLVSSYLLYASC